MNVSHCLHEETRKEQTVLKGALLFLLLSIRSSKVVEPLLKCPAATALNGPSCHLVIAVRRENKSAGWRKLPPQDLLSLDCSSYFGKGVFEEDRGVKTAGGARE